MRRTRPHRLPHERMTYEERRWQWAMPAFSGVNQFVVARAVPYESQHTPFPRVLFICQTPVIGLNGVPRTGMMRATLIRSMEGVTSVKRTALDEILEGIYGALPPLDFRLSQLIGANFLAKCQLETWVTGATRAGYARTAKIGRGSIRPLPAGTERMRPQLDFRLSASEKGLDSAQAFEHCTVEEAQAANLAPVSVDHAEPAADSAVPLVGKETGDVPDPGARMVPAVEDVEVRA